MSYAPSAVTLARSPSTSAINVRPVAAPTVFGGGPFPFAYDREAGAVDDQMDGALGWNAVTLDDQVLIPARESRVIRDIEIDTHQGENRAQKALRLAKRQCCLDRLIREPPLPSETAEKRLREPNGQGSCANARGPPTPD